MRAFLIDGEQHLVKLTEVLDCGLEACFLDCNLKILTESVEQKGVSLTVRKHELHLFHRVYLKLIDGFAYPEIEIPGKEGRGVVIYLCYNVKALGIAVIEGCSVLILVQIGEIEQVFDGGIALCVIGGILGNVVYDVDRIRKALGELGYKIVFTGCELYNGAALKFHKGLKRGIEISRGAVSSLAGLKHCKAGVGVQRIALVIL